MPELPLSDAARVLGVSADTVRRKVKTGVLTARQDERGRWWVTMSAGEPHVDEVAALRSALADAERRAIEAERRATDAEQRVAELVAEREWLRGLTAALTQRLPPALPPPTERRWRWPWQR